MADFLIHNDNSSSVSIVVDRHKVNLSFSGKEYHFISLKNLKRTIHIEAGRYLIS